MEDHNFKYKTFILENPTRNKSLEDFRDEQPHFSVSPLGMSYVPRPYDKVEVLKQPKELFSNLPPNSGIKPFQGLMAFRETSFSFIPMYTRPEPFPDIPKNLELTSEGATRLGQYIPFHEAREAEKLSDKTLENQVLIKHNNRSIENNKDLIEAHWFEKKFDYFLYGGTTEEIIMKRDGTEMSFDNWDEVTNYYYDGNCCKGSNHDIFAVKSFFEHPKRELHSLIPMYTRKEPSQVNTQRSKNLVESMTHTFNPDL